MVIAGGGKAALRDMAVCGGDRGTIAPSIFAER